MLSDTFICFSELLLERGGSLIKYDNDYMFMAVCILVKMPSGVLSMFLSPDGT